MFAAIGYPPQPIVTRWASRLNAAFYYADNLPDVKRIVGEFQGDGLLVTRAKEAIASEHLAKDLLSIDRDYKCLIELVTKCKSSMYTISDAFNDLKSLSFGSDPCGIASHLERHLEQNKDIKQIMDLASDDIPPSLYAKLRKC